MGAGAQDERPLDVRRAGVLLHITSLPSVTLPAATTTGPGDVGPAAHDFVDFLAAAGCSVWQVLPLVPTHDEDGSPYNALSTMAGNPELVSRELAAGRGLLGPESLDAEQLASFVAWCKENDDWLDPYVEFMTLRDLLGHAPWPTWE